MRKTSHFKIGGMECINCQNRIEKTLRSTKGVFQAKVSYSKGTADVEYEDSKVSAKELIKAIEKLDYKVLTPGDNSDNNIARTAGFMAIIALLYYLLQTFGLLNRLVPDRLADTGMGYGMLFVIGLITSVHCVAMCGGIGLSQSLPVKEKSGDSKSGLQTILRPLSYNLGRVCSYTVIGLCLGTVGAAVGGNEGIAIPPMLQGLLKIIAGLLMVIMGINLLGIFPVLRRFSLHAPAFISKLISSTGMLSKGPFAVGLLNGLMPCGPLQAMWIVALASGSPIKGALSMLAFSLGTLPLMLGLGSAVSLLGKKFADQVMKVGAVIVVVMGLALMTQGGNLSGLMPAWIIGSSASDSANALCCGGQGIERFQDVGSSAENEPYQIIDTDQSSDGVQLINSTLEPGRYPDITVKAGVPVKWTIDVPEGTLNGCNAVMLIQDYGIQHQFNFGENVIEFTPTKSGMVRYSCWMGMVYGSINVVE